jgi:putative ABC transport system permease protein
MTPASWPVVERLLRQVLPVRHRSTAIGDLLEEYGQYRARHGHWRAECWLWREALSLVAAYRWPASASRPPRSLIDVLAADVRHVRSAARARPGAMLAVVAVLALGIGLVSAMFALADPYVLRPLPYAKPDDLAVLSLSARSASASATLEAWNERRDLFVGVAAELSGGRLQVTPGDRDVTVQWPAVSRNFFDVLGVPVALPTEWRAPVTSAEVPVVLTAAGSRTLFGTVASVGRYLSRSDRTAGGFRVVAVLPASFLDPLGRPGAGADGFIPLGDTRLLRVEAIGSGFRATGPTVIARLQPGVTPEAAQAVLSTVSAPTPGGARRDDLVVRGVPLAALLTDRVRPLAVAALGAGLFILMVCVANVSNLLLVRGASRLREFAAREALGASRADIARLVLAELAVLTAAGVASGLGLARLELSAIARVIPAQYISLGVPSIDGRVVALALAAGVLVIVGGLVPAWAAWRVTPRTLFGAMSGAESARARVLRFVMTTVQTCVAVVLVVGAALFGRSYAGLWLQDPGYDGETFALTAIYSGQDGHGAALAQAIGTTLTGLRRLPGAASVAVAASPFVNTSIQSLAVRSPLKIDGRPVPGLVETIGGDFFLATGSRLLAGRFPTGAGTDVAVSESFARLCCNGRSPLGLVVSDGPRAFRVVAVVKDVYARALDEPPSPLLFASIDAGAPFGGVINYFVRSSAPTVQLADAVEREIHAVVASAGVSDGATLRRRLMQSVADRSFSTLMVVLFAGAALGVTAAGIVGVVASVVARRTREIAIRAAIGATRRDVQRLVMREALAAAGVGAIAGVAVSAGLSTTVKSLLFGITPADPLSLGAAALVVVGVVGVAAWMPARRATRVSPAAALRAE